jgi:hypothetical protein
MRLTPLIAFACLLAAGTVSAQETRHPPEVRAVLADARKACRDEGGRRATFSPKTVRAVDLTGGGRPDFIIDLKHARCGGTDTAFCGTGGCDFTIIVAKRDGGFSRVFSQRVIAYRIEGTSGARTVRFDFHGSRCGKAGADPCVKRHRISETPFEFADP